MAGRQRVVYSLQSEYKNDIVDYDGKERDFFREKIGIFFSKESFFNFTHVYINNEDKRFTWNIFLSDISSSFRLMAGNFNVNFGAGLLIGKKRYIPPDPFISSLKAVYGKNFSPLNSGNPVFSFYGIGGICAFNEGIFKLSINSFYSRRRRFIKSEYYESGLIKSSLSSINLKYKKKSGYTEPVTLNDRGFMIKAAPSDTVILEAFFFETFIEDESRRKILWGNFSDDSSIRGIAKYFTYGLFYQFRDDYISLFCEFGRTFKRVLGSNNNQNNIKGSGLLYGIKFKNKRSGISFTGKNATPEFYAPYSSGRYYPVRSWLFNSAVRPANNLTAGMSFSSEKKLISGNSNECLPLVRREKYFLKYVFDKRGNIKLSYDFLKLDSGGETGRKKKFKGSADIKLRFVRLLFSGAGQKSQKTTSWETACGIALKLYGAVSVKCVYSKYFIAEGNSIYADNYKDGSYISSGSSVNESVNRFSISIAYKNGNNRLSLRYENRFAGSESLRRKIEFFGKMVF